MVQPLTAMAASRRVAVLGAMVGCILANCSAAALKQTSRIHIMLSICVKAGHVISVSKTQRRSDKTYRCCGSARGGGRVRHSDLYSRYTPCRNKGSGLVLFPIIHDAPSQPACMTHTNSNTSSAYVSIHHSRSISLRFASVTTLNTARPCGTRAPTSAAAVDADDDDDAAEPALAAPLPAPGRELTLVILPSDTAVGEWPARCGMPSPLYQVQGEHAMNDTGCSREAI